MEISLANERIYGDLRLTKVDKDYPDNKLTGAEFEVYRDTNGNKELDEGDELLGKLEETSTGIYEMSHIPLRRRVCKGNQSAGGLPAG